MSKKRMEISHILMYIPSGYYNRDDEGIVCGWEDKLFAIVLLANKKRFPGYKWSTVTDCWIYCGDVDQGVVKGVFRSEAVISMLVRFDSVNTEHLFEKILELYPTKHEGFMPTGIDLIAELEGI